MYEGFFQLRKRPFAAAPVAECFLPSTSSEHALQTLTRCIERGEGPAVLVPGKLDLFSNVEDGRWTSRPNTILVDSQQLDSGNAACH